MIARLRYKYRVWRMLRKLADTRVTIVFTPDCTHTDPVYIEFNDQLYFAIRFDGPDIRIYTHATNNYPYVTAYIVWRLTQIGRTDIAGTFTVADVNTTPPSKFKETLDKRTRGKILFKLVKDSNPPTKDT